MMCRHGITCAILVLVPGGVDMRASCCGHGKGPGEILLQDGRRLVIERKEAGWRRRP